MARFSRMKVLSTITELGLVPVFYTPDVEEAKGIVRACVEGGALCLEMTNRGDGAIEVFKQLEAYCRSEFPQAILGVGSIVDAATAALYVAHGANFVVGPCLDRDTAVFCNMRKIPYSPGCGSASEIHEAEALGVEICKVFPGEQVGGPEFVKAIKGPMPWTSIMPTGGVEPTRESLQAWFGAGISAAGIGSKLITKELVKNKDWDGIAKKVRETLAIIREVRQKK
jgi:2-dehydro-3-deoxyphosphogluconate aldolase/(4S)-4-hydroxy-2-oxoglutarate aldolase